MQAKASGASTSRPTSEPETSHDSFGDSMGNELGVREAARLLGESESTVRRQADAGEIPFARRKGRRVFRRDELEQLRLRKVEQASPGHLLALYIEESENGLNDVGIIKKHKLTAEQVINARRDAARVTHALVLSYEELLELNDFFQRPDVVKSFEDLCRAMERLNPRRCDACRRAGAEPRYCLSCAERMSAKLARAKREDEEREREDRRLAAADERALRSGSGFTTIRRT